MKWVKINRICCSRLFPRGKELNFLAILLIFLGSATLLSSCDGWKVDCNSTVKPMVSEDRTVSFYANNYIYVDPSWSTTKRNQHVNLYANRIPTLLDELNNYFNKNGVNVQIIYDSNLEDGDEIVENAEMLVADINLMGPNGKTLSYVANVAKNDKQNIHIHWAEKSTSMVEAVGSHPCYGASGDCNWIIITNINISNLGFIHEFGHYLAFDTHSTDPSNFMYDPPGSDITSTQISEIWDMVNKYRTHLWYLSCKNP